MEKKKTAASIAVLVILVGLMVWWAKVQENRALAPQAPSVSTEQVANDEVVAETATPPIDYKNASYRIEDRTVTVIDGAATMPVAPGSEGMIKTSVLAGPAFADLNGDRSKDAVVIVRDEPGGSGIFYYVAALISGSDGPRSTNSLLLGDRVRIKSIEIKPAGVIDVVTMERKPGEPLSAIPSVERLRVFIFADGELKEAF